MEIRITEYEDTTLVTPVGRLDAKAASELLSMMTENVSGNTKTLVFDLLELDYISGDGIRALLFAGSVMSFNDGQTLIVNASDDVAKVLRMTGVGEYVRIQDSLIIWNNFDELKGSVRQRLSEKRYRHCERVSEKAAAIAAGFGLDVEKARLAGILHDIAKEFKDEKLLRLAEGNHLKISVSERECPHRLHGKVGAIVARNEYGITDEAVLSAIASHYGCPQMSPFEEVIFIADLEDKLVSLGLDLQIEELLDCRTLDDAVITLIGYALKYYQTIDEEPDVDIYVIYDYILEKKFRTSQAPADFGEWVKERKSEYDEDTFDRMLEVYSEHGIESAGIRNIRSLGGYNTVDGRMTSDRLMRSGMLNSMTLEDADMILKRGINYIIDLRRESEQEQFPDVVIKGLNHETCVMSSLETTEYQKDIIGIAQGEDDNRHIGYAWMNGEYLKEFDGEKMYQDYFVSEQSVASLKKIVEIMLRDDCTGVIIHCRDGKDRTGVAAGFILRLLGVGNMDIKYDYLASAVPNYARTEIFDDFFAYYQYDDEIIQNSRREKSVDQTLMKRIVCWLTQQYGSVENYYKQVLGISDETVRALREKYTV